MRRSMQFRPLLFKDQLYLIFPTRLTVVAILNKELWAKKQLCFL